MSPINIPPPQLQIDFSILLDQIRNLYLQDALSATIENLDLKKLDSELNEYVPQTKLKILAKKGLRGELVFPVPYLLESNPFLLGYYRLLLGFSQKDFYTSKIYGVSCFKPMEIKGHLSNANKDKLSKLCESFVHSAGLLLDGIGDEKISRALLDDLTLLTVGPQLRGGANVSRGQKAIIEVFEAIHTIVEKSIKGSSPNKIEIINAAGRKVVIEFAPDPDIVITEEIAINKIRNIIAIEVKGGKDFSNIHNRIGEAEKSHQKAKADGYVECWTVVNVDRFDTEMAKRESPSTNMFFRLSALKAKKGEEYQDFKDRVISLSGIKDK